LGTGVKPLKRAPFNLNPERKQSFEGWNGRMVGKTIILKKRGRSRRGKSG